MYSKTIILFTVMIIQSIMSQVIRNPYNTPYANEAAAAAAALAAEAALTYPGIPYAPIAANHAFTGLNYGLTLTELSASNGCGLRVKSGSPISPSGVTVESNNMAMEGPVSVSGQIPFLGVVALEGPLAATGAGAVAYGCGNGNVGMIAEGVDAVAPPPHNPNPHIAGYPGHGGFIAPNGVY